MEQSDLMYLSCVGVHRPSRFRYWKTLVLGKGRTFITEKIEKDVLELFLVVKNLETNKDHSLFQVNDLRLDNYVRTTKALAFLAENKLADQIS